MFYIHKQFTVYEQAKFHAYDVACITILKRETNFIFLNILFAITKEQIFSISKISKFSLFHKFGLPFLHSLK